MWQVSKGMGGHLVKVLTERLRDVAVEGRSPTAAPTLLRKRWMQQNSPGSHGIWMQLRKPYGETPAGINTSVTRVTSSGVHILTYPGEILDAMGERVR